VPGRGGPGEGAANPAISAGVSTDSPANPAFFAGPVSTNWAPSRAPRNSACGPYRERIEAGMRVGPNAMAIWQDLVDDVGFPARCASVRRFVRQLRRTAPPEARIIITTTPGEDYGESPVMVSPEEARGSGAVFLRTSFA
jgi:hypothetical protein